MHWPLKCLTLWTFLNSELFNLLGVSFEQNLSYLKLNTSTATIANFWQNLDFFFEQKNIFCTFYISNTTYSPYPKKKKQLALLTSLFLYRNYFHYPSVNLPVTFPYSIGTCSILKEQLETITI